MPSPILDLSSLGTALKPSYESDDDEVQYEFQPIRSTYDDDDKNENQVGSASVEQWMAFSDPGWQGEFDMICELPLIYGRCFKWMQEHGIQHFAVAKMIMDTWGNTAIARNLLNDDQEIQRETADQLYTRYSTFRIQRRDE